jgi:hypothetical protein
MEINLTYIFTAVTVLGALTLIFMFLLMNRIKHLENAASQESTKNSKELDNLKSEITSSAKLDLETITSVQRDASELSQQSLKDLQSTLVDYMLKNLESVQQQLNDHKHKQSLMIVSNQKLSSESFDKLAEDNIQQNNENKKYIENQFGSLQQALTNTDETVKKHTSETSALITNQMDTVKNDITSLVKLSSENTLQELNTFKQDQTLKNAAHQKLISESLNQLSKDSEQQSVENKKYIENQFSRLDQAITNTDKAVKKHSSETSTSISNEFQIIKNEFGKDLKTQTFEQKQAVKSNLLQLTGLIQGIRVGNLTELTNSIAKQKNLKVSTADFEKHLGDCKVIKMTDKHTGQVTHINYEKGIKRSSDTLAGTTLKYRMSFDDTGKVSKGVEYNDKGDISFEYEYDKAGEIGQRIEYIYSDSTKAPKKIKKAY